jgi:hypothetical protein
MAGGCQTRGAPRQCFPPRRAAPRRLAADNAAPLSWPCAADSCAHLTPRAPAQARQRCTAGHGAQAQARGTIGGGRRRSASERTKARAKVQTCGVSLTAAASGATGAAAGRYSSRAAGLVALPLFDRFTTEPPIATDAKARQPSLPEQAIDSGRMDAQMLRQFFDREDLVCLSHTLGLPQRQNPLCRCAPLEPQSCNDSLCRGLRGVKQLLIEGARKRASELHPATFAKRILDHF